MNESLPSTDRGASLDPVARCYSTWGSSYYEEFYGDQAPYPPVHADLLRSLLLSSGAKTVLDAGCGPASFLRRLGKEGLDLYGFDLTPEMVAEAKKTMATLGFNPRHFWEGSVLRPGDFVRPGLPAHYDACVCVGVLPHVPAEHETTVLNNLFQAVHSGGVVLVEARNALFSLFTQNRFTHAFLRNELMRADELLAKAGAAAGPLSAALEEWQKYFRMDLPPVRKGKKEEPGYDEVISRVHIPFVLEEQLRQTGFQEVRTFFYHYHALPPMLSGTAGAFFKKASVEMENPSDWRGHFMASAFILAATRP